jgi:hypothetical protein
MKKIMISNKMALFSASVLMLLLLSYCQHKPPVSVEDTTERLQTNEKITAFALRLNSSNSGVVDRNEEPMSVSDAVWNTEALMNARYAHADKPFEYTSVKIDTVSVAVNAEGKLTTSALSSFFDQTKENTKDNLTEVSVTTKHIVLVDVRSIGNNGLSGHLFEITSVIGYSEKTPPTPAPCDGNQTPPFTSGDDWWWAFKAGKCCLAGFVGSDAAEELEKKLNARYPLPSGHSFFTDLETKFIDPQNYPNPNSGGNLLRYYLLYRRTNPTAPTWHQPTLCITPEDMNWYYCNWWEVIGNERPQGKDFSSINVRGDATSSLITTVHWGWITYGKSNQCISDDPCDIKYPNCPETFCF